MLMALNGWYQEFIEFTPSETTPTGKSEAGLMRGDS